MYRVIRKRFIYFLLAVSVALCALLSGCSSTEDAMTDDESAANGIYRIYYVNLDETALVRRDHKAVSEDFEGLLSELLEAFTTTDSTQYHSALPSGVKINSVTTGISEITVDFSAEYLSLDSITEILLRSALVNTLLQLRGVETIRFTVDSQSLVIDDADVGAMTRDSFVIPVGDSINSYRTETLTLYFPNADGSKLIQEIRTIYYSTNVNTERMVIEQLIKGPVNPNLITITTPNVLLRGTEIKGGICTVDFNEEVNSNPFADNPTDPEVVLYAIANSIIDSSEEEIDGVRFLIEGSMDTRFRGEVNLDQTFERSADLIDTSGISVQKEGTIVDEEKDSAAVSSGSGSAAPGAEENPDEEETEASGR